MFWQQLGRLQVRTYARACFKTKPRKARNEHKVCATVVLATVVSTQSCPCDSPIVGGMDDFQLAMSKHQLLDCCLES